MANSLHPSPPLQLAPSDNENKPRPSSIQQTVLEIEVTTLNMEASRTPRNSNAGGSTQTEEGGICLTWKDLWVTVSMGKKRSRSILQGLTGYAKPGQLLAIMGPSGCGTSTLLDALAGVYFKVKLLT